MLRILLLLPPLLLASITAAAFVPGTQQMTPCTPAQQAQAPQAYDVGNKRSTSSFSSALCAFVSDDSDNEKGRRNFLRWFRRTLVAAATSVSLDGLWQPAAANADDAPFDASSGRTVEFVIQNLDGKEGQSGKVKIQLQPEWAPRGVARFEELTEVKFWDDCRFFRVLPGFIVQFGINGNPSVQGKWRGAAITDDQVKVTNSRGTVVFATSGPNSRTTQLFVNTNGKPGGNAFLDKQGFSPIGKVIEGMDIIDQCYSGYGEGAPSGKGPSQSLIQFSGNSYLQKSFPALTYIESAKFV